MVALNGIEPTSQQVNLDHPCSGFDICADKRVVYDDFNCRVNVYNSYQTFVLQ